MSEELEQKHRKKRKKKLRTCKDCGQEYRPFGNHTCPKKGTPTIGAGKQPIPDAVNPDDLPEADDEVQDIVDPDDDMTPDEYTLHLVHLIREARTKATMLQRDLEKQQGHVDILLGELLQGTGFHRLENR